MIPYRGNFPRYQPETKINRLPMAEHHTILDYFDEDDDDSTQRGVLDELSRRDAEEILDNAHFGRIVKMEVGRFLGGGIGRRQVRKSPIPILCVGLTCGIFLLSSALLVFGVYLTSYAIRSIGFDYTVRSFVFECILCEVIWSSVRLI